MENEIINILIIGDQKVGKSSLINYYLDIEVSKNYKPTLGINMFSKNYLKNNLIKFWEISGNKNYSSLIDLSINHMDGIILCFSIDNKESLYNIEKLWFKELKNIENKKIILLGNKLDLKRKINYTESHYISKKLKIIFFECSTYNGYNIKKSINFLLNEISKVQNNSLKTTINYIKPNKNKKNKKPIKCF